jgi:hypothetical protein
MCSVERLLRSRHSVGSELELQSEETNATDKDNDKKRGSREAECVPSNACSEAAIQSEVKATQRKTKRPVKRKKRRRINEAICIHWNTACYDVAIQSEAKPTLHQKEKGQAQEREIERKRDGSMKQYAISLEDSLLRSSNSVGSETGTASGRGRGSTREREREKDREQ